MRTRLKSAPLGLIFSAAVATTSVAASRIETFEGEVFRADNGQLMVDTAELSAKAAKQVLKACAISQQCIVRGRTTNCPGVNGGCILMTGVISARWGKDLPPCAVDAAVQDMADKWWSEGSAVSLTGTIRRGGEEMAIMVPVSSCSTSAPLRVSQVPDRWVGRTVKLSGTAAKEDGVWIVVAKDVQAAQ